MNLNNLNKNQQSYIRDILEDFETLNYRNFNDMKFSSTKTKHIELIIGQEEFISLSLLTKKEDLNDFNIISIFEPTETILPIELYESFNSHLILIFADIRKKIEDTNLSLNEKEELSKLEIQNKDFEILKDYILNNKDKKFIINCQVGVSRSAAIGIILENLLNDNQIDIDLETNKILSHWRYSPNPIILEKYLKKKFRFREYFLTLKLSHLDIIYS